MEVTMLEVNTLTNVLARPAVQASNILTQVGNTPLLDLSGYAHRHGVSPRVDLYAKAEWCNPGGSVKARAALRMVEEAEASGALTPGKVIIDSSSGNTGIALALIGAVKGYAVHLVMPANVSLERKALVKAYGATLIESDPLEGSDGAILHVRELVAREPARYFYVNQYNNPANWRAHYLGTGPEIWRQTEGAITHFVAGLGTSGTFMGTGRYLKERNAGIELIAVQPEDELAVIEGLKHLETAIIPGIYDARLPDRAIGVPADDALAAARSLAREAGLFVGMSAGAAVAASIKVARRLEAGVVVTILPDDGSKYVSLGFSGKKLHHKDTKRHEGAQREMNNRVDQTALKFNQASIIVLLVLAFLLNAAWLVALVAAVMLIGTFWPQAGLFKLFYARLLKPAGLLKPKVVEDDPAPHLFAQGLGGVFLVLSTLALWGGLAVVGWLLAGMVVVLAAINLFLNFCLGCFIYFQFARRGVRLELPGWRTA